MKKGFTIIEIIISIGLILLVGTTSIVSFNYIKNKKNVSILNGMSDEILTALRLYIETNNDLKSSVYEDKEGLVVTLKTLENNGLIDFTDVDIDDKYVVALLSQESDCTDITTVNNWDVTGGTLNICLKGSSNSQSVKETLISSGSYIAKGANPNNWVIFEVESKTDEVTYFPNDDDKNLWQIVSINDNGNIKLVYNKVIGTNNELMGAGKSERVYDGLNFYKFYSDSDIYYRYMYNDIWTYEELISDEGKKSYLLNSIKNKGWLISSNYHLKHGIEHNGESLNYIYQDLENSITLNMGTINYEEYLNSFVFQGTYLNKNFLMGNYYDGSTGIIYMETNGGYIMDTVTTRLIKQYYKINGAPYLPTVVLNEKVNLVKNNSCNGVQGSKECPYKLECNNC